MRVIDGNRATMRYTYGIGGQLESVIYPTGETISADHYINGSLSRMSTSEGVDYVSGYDYTPLGQITHMEYGNGVTTTYDYYDQSFETDWGTSRAYSFNLRTMDVRGPQNQGIATIDFEYDEVGNVVQRAFRDEAGNSFTESFLYDDLGRLQYADAPNLYPSGAPLTYQYNEINNLTLKDNRNYVYGSDRPHAVTWDGLYTYEYDANGNMITRNVGQPDERTVAYDDENRVKSVTEDGMSVWYRYDADGTRVSKSDGTRTTYYFFPEYEETWVAGVREERMSYYFANDQRVAQRSTVTGLFYYHADHLGSAVRLTDELGRRACTILCVNSRTHSKENEWPFRRKYCRNS